MLNTKQVRQVIRNDLGIKYRMSWTNGGNKGQGNKRELCFIISNTDAERLDEVKTTLSLMGHTGKVYLPATFCRPNEKYLRITQLSMV